MDKKELELSGKLLVEAIELMKKGNLKAIAQSEPLGKYERRLTKKESYEIIRHVKRAHRHL